MENFYTGYYSTTFFLPENTTQDKMITEIKEAAKKNGIEVFVYERQSASPLNSSYHIYGTENVEKKINENLNIYTQEYSSLFLGKVSFDFHDLNELKDISNVYDYYIMGDKDQADQFKIELIDKYAGNFPQEGFIYHNSEFMVLISWIVAIGIIIVLSFYDVLLQKKENVVRVTMGESIHRIYVKNISLDILAYVLSFLIAIVILNNFTFIFYKFTLALLLFGLLIVINSIIFLNLYSYRINETLKNSKQSRKILSLNYVLKSITAVLTILLISSNIAVIFESYEMYKQKPFFEKHENYFYTRIENKLEVTKDGNITGNTDEDSVIQEKFYRTFFKKADATLLTDISGIVGKQAIYANKNTLAYLKEHIHSLTTDISSKQFYFIVPESYKSSETDLLPNLTHAIEFYEGNNLETDKYDVIYYKENVKLISIDDLKPFGSEFLLNPIILYNNISSDQLVGEISPRIPKLDFFNDIMYRISDNEFNDFITKNGYSTQTVNKVNVLEKFNEYWSVAKRLMYMNIIFTLLILALELIMIISIVKLEYQVNAIELSLKKVFGYTLFQKNKKIYLMTIITNSLTLLLAILVSFLASIGNPVHIAVGGCLIFLTEILVISYYVAKIERLNIQRVLKGETS
ncbi:DUF1430 domain-containing protein [Paenibacillus amylolyticus]|uniref:DUF1430 domain-containing protein n=1 Tax=Paenibacillus amylolyticus TaxID=1451 RepID=UPI0039B089D3